MPPGGATPIGTFGAISAALELAEQIAAGLAPAPRRIVVPIGSTCTTAGLVAGIALAQAIGAWRWPVPIVHAVRVTPWPVTSRLRTAELAARTLDRIAALGGPRVAVGFSGARKTPRRRRARARQRLRPRHACRQRRARRARPMPGAPRLDGVYSAKTAAALLRLHRDAVAPSLFWSTKSTTRLAPPSLAALRDAPHHSAPG